MSLALSYTADEPSFTWDVKRKPRAAGLFDLRPPTVPFDAKPVYDADLDCIIGYQKEVAGVFSIYTLDGDVSVSERSLEPPLIDPLDMLLMVGGVWRAALRGLTEWGIRGVGVPLGRATLLGLRTKYYALMQRPLRFTAAPLEHMANPYRYVPVHILRLAIKYGKRTVDPRGHAGLFMYRCPMTHEGKTYMLEVLVRENDYTILHFMYKHLK